MALEEAILKRRRRDTATTLSVAYEGYNDDTTGPLLPGAKIPQLLDHGVRGDLCIYTTDSPCQAYDDASGKFSCADYYNALVQYFPYIKIHIYYKNPSINPQSLSSKEEIVNGLIALIKEFARNEREQTIWCTDQEGKRFAHFKLGEEDRLLFNNSTYRSSKQSWKEATSDVPVFLNKVNRFLGCSSAEPKIITFKDQIIRVASDFVPNISNNLIQAPSRDQ